MEHHDRIIELLTRVEQNQQRSMQFQQEAIEAQRQHMELTRTQLERANRDIDQSIELQRIAVKRQAQIRNFAMPLIGVLLLLMVYLLVKGRVFF